VKGNTILSALAKYVMNRLIHGVFHIAIVISPRIIQIRSGKAKFRNSNRINKAEI
jgi:hypothetical protein